MLSTYFSPTGLRLLISLLYATMEGVLWLFPVICPSQIPFPISDKITSKLPRRFRTKNVKLSQFITLNGRSDPIGGINENTRFVHAAGHEPKIQ